MAEIKKAVETRYYPVVVESQTSYPKPTSDEYYLVIHNKAVNVLLEVALKSVIDSLLERLVTKIDPSQQISAETLRAEVDTWLDDQFADQETQSNFKKKFEEKIAEDKEKYDAYMSGSDPYSSSDTGPKRNKLLVYDPVKI
ncbi:MAG: hypothetical protein ACPG7F_21380, partial [Aggregatilineales bacterium]